MIITGRLVAASCPHGSGLATLDIDDLEDKRHRLYIESGFGLRQLHEAMGGYLQDLSLIAYHVGPLGLVEAVELVDDFKSHGGAK